MDPRNHESGKPMAANRKKRVYFSCSYRGYDNAVTPDTNAIRHFLEWAAGLFLYRDGRPRCRRAPRRNRAIVKRHGRTWACHIALGYEDGQRDQKQQQDIVMRPRGRIAQLVTRRSGRSHWKHQGHATKHRQPVPVKILALVYTRADPQQSRNAQRRGASFSGYAIAGF